MRPTTVARPRSHLPCCEPELRGFSAGTMHLTNSPTRRRRMIYLHDPPKLLQGVKLITLLQCLPTMVQYHQYR